MGIVIKAFEEVGVKIPAPYERISKVLFNPEKQNRPDLKFGLNLTLIAPHSKTDKHIHPTNELIFIISGRGEATLGDMEVVLEPDVVFLAEINEPHQVRNTGDQQLKLACYHVPPRSMKKMISKNLEAAKNAQKNNVQ